MPLRSHRHPDPVTGTESGEGGAELHLLPTADAALLARRYVRTRLVELGRTDLDDTLTLAASELVTNAAIHAGTPVVVRLGLDADGAVLTVRDTSPVLPRQRHQPPNATTGRGLLILEALGEMSVVTDPDLLGKTVWFRPHPSLAGPTGPPLTAPGEAPAQ
jgi:anti-sigma regulatory factor (Ser/Thr protein kinase)